MVSLSPSAHPWKKWVVSLRPSLIPKAALEDRLGESGDNQPDLPSAAFVHPGHPWPSPLAISERLPSCRLTPQKQRAELQQRLGSAGQKRPEL